jgi:hypothetical protein
MKLELQLMHNNITLSLDCQKLWYKLLGTEFVFMFRIRRVLGCTSAPTSSLFSEIYLPYLENTKVFDILVKHRLIGYFRYVDDNAANIHEVQNTFNKLTPTMHLTVEEEVKIKSII